MKINSSYLLATKAAKVSGGGGGSFPSWATDYFLFPAADVSAAGIHATLGATSQSSERITGTTLAAGCENGGYCLFWWQITGTEWSGDQLDGVNYDGFLAGKAACYTYASKSDAVRAVLSGNVGNPVYTSPNTDNGMMLSFHAVKQVSGGSIWGYEVVQNGIYSYVAEMDNTGIVTVHASHTWSGTYYASNGWKDNFFSLNPTIGWAEYDVLVKKPLR